MGYVQEKEREKNREEKVPGASVEVMPLQSTAESDEKEKTEPSVDGNFPKEKNIGDESPSLEHFGGDEIKEERVGQAEESAEHQGHRKNEHDPRDGGNFPQKKLHDVHLLKILEKNEQFFGWE